MSMMDGDMILWMILWIFIVGLFIYGGFMLLMKLSTKTKEQPIKEQQEDSSMKILRDRYAHGEIDEQEFEAKKAFLQNK